jgi:glycosyltransferase involved in cell wall biosynthesis
MIKAIHLQRHLPASGNAAFRLHEAMRLSGIDSTMLSLSSDIEESKQIKHLGKKSSLISLLDARCGSFLTKSKKKEFGIFSYPLFGTDVSKLPQIQNADFVYLHWVIGGFLSLHGIENLCKIGKPIILFIHDMWPITGGCHYSFDCEKFKIECNNCQIFPKEKKIDLALKEFKKKLILYSKYNNLFFVSPSKWMYNQIKESTLTKEKPVFHIPNIINNKVFKQNNRLEARRILDLDSDSLIISFGAVSVDSPYKGWSYLQEALSILKCRNQQKNILVVIFGSGFNEQIERDIPFPIRFLGRLRDDFSTALLYNASNIFVAPSLADNLPTTIMESLACGTAVVGFNIGGIPDMVIHKKNGYLANYKDSSDLAAGIEYCIENNLKGYLSEDFKREILIEKHLKLFDLIKNK